MHTPSHTLTYTHTHTHTHTHTQHRYSVTHSHTHTHLAASCQLLKHCKRSHLLLLIGTPRWRKMKWWNHTASVQPRSKSLRKFLDFQFDFLNSFLIFEFLLDFFTNFSLTFSSYLTFLTLISTLCFLFWLLHPKCQWLFSSDLPLVVNKKLRGKKYQVSRKSKTDSNINKDGHFWSKTFQIQETSTRISL